MKNNLQLNKRERSKLRRRFPPFLKKEIQVKPMEMDLKKLLLIHQSLTLLMVKTRSLIW